jgi:hypothetical protein
MRAEKGSDVKGSPAYITKKVYDLTENASS